MSEHLDEPYTRITNHILEEIAKRRFNGTQYGIIIVVLRNTYGFQRKSHRLSISFLADATQCNKTQVKRELDKLIEMKVINVYDEGNRVISRDIGFNKHFNEWQLAYTRNRVYANQSTPELEYTVDANQSTQGVRELEYQERNKIFKETLKEMAITTEEQIPPQKLLEDAFCDLHKVGNWTIRAKEIMDMNKLISGGIPLNYIMDTMTQIHKDKSSKGERIKSFCFYTDAIAESWRARIEGVKASEEYQGIIGEIRSGRNQAQGTSGSGSTRELTEAANRKLERQRASGELEHYDTSDLPI